MAKPCAAAYIPAGVHGDAHKIRLFAAFIAKCVHGLVHLEKGFLNRVLGQLLVSKHRVTHTAQVRLVLFQAACLQLLQAFTTKQNGFRLRLSNEREAESILPNDKCMRAYLKILTTKIRVILHR